MLGKLWKYEIKMQGRTVLGICGILAAAAVIVSAVYLVSQLFGGNIAEVVFAVSGSIYVLTVAGCAVSGFIYLCVHFYQSMYSSQGYLTHTLPVKTLQILHVKIAVSAGSLFLILAVCAVSVTASVMVWDGLSVFEVFQVIGQGLEQTGKELGVNALVFVLFAAAMMILGCFVSLLMFFAGSSIGQLAGRSKGACGIAAGVGLYYACQIVTVIVIVAAAAGLWEKGVTRSAASWMVMGTAAAVILFWSVVFYVICRVIVQKHLNLE